MFCAPSIRWIFACTPTSQTNSTRFLGMFSKRVAISSATDWRSRESTSREALFVFARELASRCAIGSSWFPGNEHVVREETKIEQLGTIGASSSPCLVEFIRELASELLGRPLRSGQG